MRAPVLGDKKGAIKRKKEKKKKRERKPHCCYLCCFSFGVAHRMVQLSKHYNDYLSRLDRVLLFVMSILFMLNIDGWLIKGSNVTPIPNHLRSLMRSTKQWRGSSVASSQL